MPKKGGTEPVPSACDVNMKGPMSVCGARFGARRTKK